GRFCDKINAVPGGWAPLSLEAVVGSLSPAVPVMSYTLTGRPAAVG
ncbi:hypothetical protein AVEN_33199-1, partial [Araneus ventricosus]